MPLIFASFGNEYTIKRISGNPKVKQHLADLGFVVGSCVEPISNLNGNLIVRIKESRIALGKDMAMHILV